MAPDTESGIEIPPSRFTTPRVVWLLDEDPELHASFGEGASQHARMLSAAGVVNVLLGEWSPASEARQATGGLGLLIMEGLLLRELGPDRRCAAELLGEGDLIDPVAELDGDDPTLGPPRWRALAGTRLAVLDADWVSRMARYPEMLAEMSRRHLNRARRSAARMAIAAEPRLDRRVMMLLWELAYRFGTVQPDGVHVALPMTHEILAHLVFARRPSVSTAIGRLQSEGLLWRDAGSWVLRHGSSPIESVEGPQDRESAHPWRSGGAAQR